MKGGREKGSVGVAGRRQGPYFSPGTHSNNVPSHSSLELISAQASVAWEWESCRCQRESCLVPTWRQIEKDEDRPGGRRRDEREMQPESIVPGSLVLGINVRAQTQLRLFFLSSPGHALVCLRRQEHGGSLWNYQGKWEVNGPAQTAWSVQIPGSSMLCSGGA